MVWVSTNIQKTRRCAKNETVSYGIPGKIGSMLQSSGYFKKPPGLSYFIMFMKKGTIPSIRIPEKTFTAQGWVGESPWVATSGTELHHVGFPLRQQSAGSSRPAYTHYIHNLPVARTKCRETAPASLIMFCPIVSYRNIYTIYCFLIWNIPQHPWQAISFWRKYLFCFCTGSKRLWLRSNPGFSWRALHEAHLLHCCYLRQIENPWICQNFSIKTTFN